MSMNQYVYVGPYIRIKPTIHLDITGYCEDNEANIHHVRIEGDPHIYILPNRDDIVGRPTTFSKYDALRQVINPNQQAETDAFRKELWADLLVFEEFGAVVEWGILAYWS